MIVSGEKARKALAVVDIAGKSLPTVVALFSDADIRSFRWVGNDRLVFNLIDVQSGGGDQRFGPGLYSVHRDGTAMRQLIKSKREFVRAAVGPSHHETLEWNYALLTVPDDGGHEVIIGQYVYDRLLDLQAVNAMRLDVDTGRTRSLAAGSPANSRDWWFDPQGEPRAIVAVHQGVAKTYWRAPGQDEWRLIATDPDQNRVFSPYFVDGSGALLVSTGNGRDGEALKRYDFASGKPEKDPIVSTPGFDLNVRIITNAEGTTISGLRIVTDAETIVWFDAGMKAIQKAVDAAKPGHINVVTACSRCDNVNLVLVYSRSDQDPGSYWVYRPAANEWQAVGKARADIDPSRMATLDFHRIKARDGLDLPVWVTTPSKSAPQTGTGPRPAIVLVHGGPWVRGTYWQWDADAQFLASRGYVVIEPEYRGSTGFGFSHFRAGWKQWGGPMQDDVADSVRWAAEKGLVDPKRVCIAGASYGGYATLMGLALYPSLYRCGVAWVAVTDPRLLFDDSWQSDMSEEGRKYELPTLLGDPEKDATMLRAAAPLEHAADIRAPLLLAFGREDRRVPIVHGTSMRDALHANGHDPEWVVYEGEGHGWLKVDNRIDFWTRVERFLGNNLNAAPPAAH